MNYTSNDFNAGESYEIELKRYQSIWLKTGGEIQSKKFHIEIISVYANFEYATCKINSFFKGGRFHACKNENIVLGLMFKDIAKVHENIKESSI